MKTQTIWADLAVCCPLSLKMLNELLEQQHRTGHPNNGSKIEIVYVASGGQHVERK